MDHFLMALWHMMKSEFYMKTGDNQLSGWTEKKLQSTSQSQECTKKKGHGHCLVVCCWSDLLQLYESQQNHYIWEVCSASWWDLPKTAMPTVGTGQQKGPSSSPQQCLTTHHTTNISKVVWIGLQSFALSTTFSWPLYQPSTTSSISTTFCRENATTTSRKQKMLSKNSSNPEAQIFMLQE